MSNVVQPMGPWERAILQLVVGYHEMVRSLDADDALERVGGTFDYAPPMPWYVRIESVFSQADRFGGSYGFDLEVFAPASGTVAESVSNDLEALLLGYPHVVEVDGEKFIIDTVSQNSGPQILPWEDESATRLGATYVLTARRR